VAAFRPSAWRKPFRCFLLGVPDRLRCKLVQLISVLYRRDELCVPSWPALSIKHGYGIVIYCLHATNSRDESFEMKLITDTDCISFVRDAWIADIDVVGAGCNINTCFPS
jgi:hypothetical protein